MRTCRKGLHEIPAGKEECPVCKKARDDVHRLNDRLSGKAAARWRERKRYRYQTDPVFREADKEASRRYHLEHRAPAKRLGVTVAAYRSMMPRDPSPGGGDGADK